MTDYKLFRDAIQSKKVVDTFTNQLLYEGNKAKEVFKKINTIGMYNANILDTGSKAKMKLMYIA